MLDRSIDHLAEADAEHGLSDEEDEDEDICGFDNGRHQQDATEAKGRDDACSDEQSRTKRNRDRYDNKQSGLNDVDAVDHINYGRHQYGTDEETVRHRRIIAWKITRPARSHVAETLSKFAARQR